MVKSLVNKRWIDREEERIRNKEITGGVEHKVTEAKKERNEWFGVDDAGSVDRVYSFVEEGGDRYQDKKNLKGMKKGKKRNEKVEEGEDCKMK